MDQGNHYDSAPVPPVVVTNSKRSKHMSKFKLELKTKTVLQKLAMGVNHIAAMLGNLFYPQATRVPTDAQYQTAQDELQAANDAVTLLEGQLTAAANLRATMGDLEGEIDLQWDAIYGAVSYIIECREYNPATGWSQIKFLKQSKFTVAGLVSGKTYAFRVRALGPKGEGPWSDEAVKMAA
jgi:hypothetical protein